MSHGLESHMHDLVVHPEQKDRMKEPFHRAAKSLGSIEIDMTFATGRGGMDAGGLIGCPDYHYPLIRQISHERLKKLIFLFEGNMFDDIETDHGIELSIYFPEEVVLDESNSGLVPNSPWPLRMASASRSTPV